MLKYRFMLIIPFLILIIAAWGNLGSGDKEIKHQLEQQQKLIEEAEKFAEDKIYFRAADKLEEAKKLNVGDINAIEKKLLEYYFIDEDHKSWLALSHERLSKKMASEEEILKTAEYYKDRQDYKDMISVLNRGLEIYPDSAEMTAARNLIKYYYSYTNCNFEKTAAGFGERIAVYSDGKWGFASADGSSSGNFSYDKAVSFCGGFAAVAANGEVFLINKELKKYSLCHDSRIDGVFLFDGSKAVVTMGDKYLLADTEMEIISEPFDLIGSVSEEMYPAKKGDKWIFIDGNGNQTISAEYEDIALNVKYSAFFNGIAFVRENGSYRMIDAKGEYVSDSVFEGAYPFMEKNSLAAVKLNGKWGFADIEGNVVIPCEYEDAKSFSYGLGAVKTGGKWGYINRNGEMLIPVEYDEAEPFENRRALVYSRMDCGFICLDYYE